MKKLVMSLSLLAGASAAYSQGTINWTSYIAQAGSNPGFAITIWGPGTTETPGTGAYPNNTPSDLPAGSASYSGSQLSGAGYEVGLYIDTSVGAVTGDVTAGTPLATSALAGPGYWDSSFPLTATSATLPEGTAVYPAIAAWSTADGATSYAQAVSEGVAHGYTVASATTPLGGPVSGAPPATPGTLQGTGLQDFVVGGSAVPEPSTIALGVIGASTFLMRLRRKQ
jgi:hypothetical protein